MARAPADWVKVLQLTGLAPTSCLPQLCPRIEHHYAAIPQLGYEVIAAPVLGDLLDVHFDVTPHVLRYLLQEPVELRLLQVVPYVRLERFLLTAVVIPEALNLVRALAADMRCPVAERLAVVGNPLRDTADRLERLVLTEFGAGEAVVVHDGPLPGIGCVA